MAILPHQFRSGVPDLIMTVDDKPTFRTRKCMLDVNDAPRTHSVGNRGNGIYAIPETSFIQSKTVFFYW